MTQTVRLSGAEAIVIETFPSKLGSEALGVWTIMEMFCTLKFSGRPTSSLGLKLTHPARINAKAKAIAKTILPSDFNFSTPKEFLGGSWF
jgi:hypothetical protein